MTKTDTAHKKKNLRIEAKRIRAAIPSVIEDAAAFAARFIETSLPLKSRILAGYWPMRDEADPRALMDAARAAGGALALPTISQPKHPLVFKSYTPGEALASGPHGTSEPGPAAMALTPDIVLVPLLAFDRRGGRLGYGGGYYDRTLAALRAKGSVTAIGLAYAAQEVDAVPTDPLDERLDWVVTERGALECRV
ncbi:MAG: 5-formyltetrahydrofolate cyclo-ligase [Pseudomonadota bacterium]